MITPACEPVNDRASAPSAEMAIATSALEIRSPEVSSMSSSRAGGDGETCWARSISSSVVSPIAETTTTTSLPSLRGGDDPFGDPLDPLRRTDRRTAVLLDDEPHCRSRFRFVPRHGCRATFARQTTRRDPTPRPSRTVPHALGEGCRMTSRDVTRPRKVRPDGVRRCAENPAVSPVM